MTGRAHCQHQVAFFVFCFAVLCKAVDEKDKEQLEKILPVLQKRLTQATQGLTECLNLRDTAQAW